jgi:glutathione peroxidase
MLRCLLLALAAVGMTAADPSSSGTRAMTPASATSAHAFTLTANDGTPAPLAAWSGKVVLLVNTASRCGLTPQYAALQALHESRGAKGLVVVAVPANEFGGQEPGTDAQIKDFCQTRFKVSFPLMRKITVKGAGIDPLYEWLTVRSPFPGPIAWNFTKFLIGPDGRVIARFEPKTTPDDPAVTAAIDAALAGLPPR